MAFRSGSAVVSRSLLCRFMERAPRSPSAVVSRCFSDGKGRVLSEEERGQENVYIQKMEKERMEKMKQKLEKEKTEKEKESGDKKPEGESHKE